MKETLSATTAYSLAQQVRDWSASLASSLGQQAQQLEAMAGTLEEANCSSWRSITASFYRDQLLNLRQGQRGAQNELLLAAQQTAAGGQALADRLEALGRSLEAQPDLLTQALGAALLEGARQLLILAVI